MEAGLTSGTWQNKGVQQQGYLSFMKGHGSDPVNPSQYDVLSYMVHLDNSLTSPGAALNYVSGARTWVHAMGGDLAPFDSYTAGSSTHEPVQAPPLTPDNI